MSEEWTRLNLRLPIHLNEWLQEEAAKARRSRNAECVTALEFYKAAKTSESTATGSASQA